MLFFVVGRVADCDMDVRVDFKGLTQDILTRVSPLFICRVVAVSGHCDESYEEAPKRSGDVKVGGSHVHQRS